jgi:hypothetical protein
MTYHVRRKEREVTDPQEIESVIASGKYCILGLAKDNEPYVVTLSYAYDKAANALFFHCGPQGQKLDFIRANPLACATIIEDDGFDADACDHSYRSLVLRGRIEFVEDSAEIDRAIRLMVVQLERKDPDKGFAKLKAGNKFYDTLCMLKLTIESVTGKAKHVPK